MQANQEIFMLVAKEMSISRAADQAFVSQQCVSDHIKRMEQHYGIKLFTRKPRFQLTEAGAALFASLQKIQAIEANISKDMTERASGIKGSFTMGISASRAQIVLPWIMPEYCRAFPHVEVRFFLNDTIVLEENLLQGRIDLFLGINTTFHEEFTYRRLCEDELYFMISEDLLRRHFGDKAKRILSQEIDLHFFTEVPFIQSYSTSVVNTLVQEYLDEQHISLHTLYQISDTDTQISLCAKGVGAVITPRMLLSRIQSHNRTCSPEEFLHIRPMKHLKRTLCVDLVTQNYIEKPLYVRAFADMLAHAIQNHYHT